MKVLLGKWVGFMALLGVGVIFAVSAAFVCAGIILFVAHHIEMAVLFAFAVWLLWFGWQTKEELDTGEEVS